MFKFQETKENSRCMFCLTSILGASTVCHSLFKLGNAPSGGSKVGVRPRARNDLVLRLAAAGARPPPGAECEPVSEAEDVIDLGRPRLRRRQRVSAGPPRPPRLYTPNPRLYPGPGANLRAKSKAKRAKESEGRSSAGRARRRKRVFRRPVPNARLYRPAAPRPPPPPPPPARPRAAWPPPARLLDTASHAALRLSSLGEQRRRPPSAPRTAPPHRLAAPEPPYSPPSPLGQRLVVTLPASAAGGEPLPRYRPASEHFRVRSLDTDSGASTPPAARPSRPPAMEPSASPEDGSDGNDTHSAPSEFLAEFLSAIMRRQYAEALKYCRLILQYEPHNATARGFYPLLQHKAARARPASSSDDVSAPPPLLAGDALHSSCSACSEGSGGSECSQSSLEMDSGGSSPSGPSLSPAPHTDSASGASGASGTSGGSSSPGGARWASSGSSRSEPDDNGNPAPPPPHRAAHSPQPGDVENDNAVASGEPSPVLDLKTESAASLRRLREQFACSIK